jgi:hypothetical protein
MSWSVNFIGKQEKVVSALEEHSTKLDGQSKVEYDSALPSLVALVKQNFNKDQHVIVKITANGHGHVSNGEEKYRTCSVSIENIYGVLV